MSCFVGPAESILQGRASPDFVPAESILYKGEGGGGSRGKLHGALLGLSWASIEPFPKLVPFLVPSFI